MFDINKIKGIIFDYGGTIDSNGMHWSEVIWNAYRSAGVPVSKDSFREAYVYGERYLASHKIIQPGHNFYELLKIKITIQVQYLIDKHLLEDNDKTLSYALVISGQCYNFVRNLIDKEKHLFTALQKLYPMVLVSNFYGNIKAVLEDFNLSTFFDNIIESAVVGVRKPDPEIFVLGIKSLGFNASEVIVIGDSYTKDIIPAAKAGCHTIWLKGTGWGDDSEDATADIIISDFKELKSIFHLD